MKKIEMVDLKNQYIKIKNEIDENIIKCIESTNFINGPSVKNFSDNLSKYLNVKHVIPCANGTDAIQIALMSLNLNKGDEVICPAFTYFASAEAIALLGLVPIMADVEYDTFNIEVNNLEKLITTKTKAIIPVHLYGQSCNLEKLLDIANKYKLYIVEDNAQAIGSEYTFSNGEKKFTGTIGNIGTTSFFPSKNLGCYGDGGAIFTNDDDLAIKLKMIANHGQIEKYKHKYIGCNSRLDSIQAEILNIKLQYLDDYIISRNLMAEKYDYELKNIDGIEIPFRYKNSNHVFHQYTIKVLNNRRDDLIKFLNSFNIPCQVYYPIPIYRQEAFKRIMHKDLHLQNTEKLCNEVLSLPIHTEQNIEDQNYIIDKIKSFFLN